MASVACDVLRTLVPYLGTRVGLRATLLSKKAAL